jgi:mRNA interferase RelE/StbE
LGYRIEFKSSVSHDLRKLDKETARRIISEIHEFLSDNPSSGERLHGEFQGLYKLRLGDYRVIYAIIKDRVLILRISHRSKAYE